MLRNRRTSYQELCDHEDFLTKLSGELIKTIQDTEDGAALKVRMLLQQQDVYTVILPALAPQPHPPDFGLLYFSTAVFPFDSFLYMM